MVLCFSKKTKKTNKIMKKILITIIFISSYFHLNSQEVLLHKYVDNDIFQEKKFGPNSLYYLYNFFSLNFFTPAIYYNQLDINYQATYELNYGVRFQLKIFELLATGFDAHINFQNYNLKNVFNQKYAVPRDTKQRLSLTNLGSEAFLRFSFSKHGNTIGKYIDFAYWIDFQTGNRFVSKTIYNTKTLMTKNKIVQKKLHYYAPFSYGLTMRLGFTKIAFLLKYRLSELLQTADLKEINADLPKLSIGFEFALVK
jgi:hypothetical protein